MTLTKLDISEKIAKHMGLYKSESMELLESVLSVVKTTLKGGEEVRISGFGKFAIRHKTARQGRNLHTSEPLYITPRKVVSFKASPVLREKINGAKHD